MRALCQRSCARESNNALTGLPPTGHLDELIRSAREGRPERTSSKTFAFEAWQGGRPGARTPISSPRAGPRTPLWCPSSTGWPARSHRVTAQPFPCGTRPGLAFDWFKHRGRRARTGLDYRRWVGVLSDVDAVAHAVGGCVAVAERVQPEGDCAELHHHR